MLGARPRRTDSELRRLEFEFSACVGVVAMACGVDVDGYRPTVTQLLEYVHVCRTEPTCLQTYRLGDSHGEPHVC